MSDKPNKHAPMPDPVILVVERDRRDVDLFCGILKGSGFEAIASSSGAEAFEQMKKQTPDLILLGAATARPSALELCRQLKADPETEKIPIVLMVDGHDHAMIIEALGAGAVDYIPKPFQPEELLARLRTHLELKKAREAILQSAARLRELNAEKSEFLSVVAHDLRSPLSNIVTSASMILSDPQMSRVQENEFLEIIRTSAQHMIHLVENLMDVTAIEHGRMRMDMAPCELGELVRGVTSNYQSKARAKQQELSMTATPEPLVALADPHSTIQVFDNLVSNAIKYSPPGKRIDVRLLRRDRVIRCEVQDQGPGLSEEDLNKMFRKFTRLTPQPTGGESSTGLGLSIVKKIVEAGGGNVWCESELGKGSIFVVELPSAN